MTRVVLAGSGQLCLDHRYICIRLKYIRSENLSSVEGAAAVSIEGCLDTLVAEMVFTVVAFDRLLHDREVVTIVISK